MFLVMGVTLYTSRVVLEQLGVSDYGIYSIVGGIVAVVGFFRSAMASATRRYLAFDIGKNDFEKLTKTFSATLTIHFCIAILFLLLTETVGLWYINNKMNYPEDRVYAVNIVYQFSILTFLLNIIQTPYDALITARERMNVYAFISLFEVALKLLAVYLLIHFGSDKLIVFSILTFITTLIIRLCYQLYCRINFKESKYKFEYDKKYYKELIIYSGWNLFGNVAVVARGQGNNLVLNLFYGTIVNAAYGITQQLQAAIQMFVSNLQLAFNPQIIKSFASGEKKESLNLAVQGAKFSFFLVLLLITPILYNTQFVLQIWLKNVPDYVVQFVQMTLISVLIDSISGTLMTLIQANGKIKLYQIVVGTLTFLTMPLSYCFLMLGYEPSIVFKIIIIISLLSLIVRLAFLKKMVQFDVRLFILNVIIPISLVVISLIASVYVLTIYFPKDGRYIEIFNIILILFITLILGFVIGLNRQEKSDLIKLFNKKIRNK